MKKLIYRPDTDIYYLSDESSNPKGKSRILKYKASTEEMPHTHFREYVLVYGRLTCPYCQKTFNLLEKKNNQITNREFQCRLLTVKLHLHPFRHEMQIIDHHI